MKEVGKEAAALPTSMAQAGAQLAERAARLEVVCKGQPRWLHTWLGISR